MEQKRRQTQIGELHIEIARIEKSLQRDEETLKNISKANVNQEFIQKKKTEINDSKIKKTSHLETLRQKLIDTQEGKLDKEIAEEIEKESKIYHSKRDAAMKKKMENFKEEQDKKTILYSKPKEKENKYIEKDYAYFLKIHNNIGNSLPDYIKENLKGMPNNKGYIWRGCVFLGYLEREYRQPLVYFEKLRGNITRIHETDEYETRIYEKQGRDRKCLISKRPRNNYKLDSRVFLRT